MEFNRQVFRGNDIRGKVPSQINIELASLIGRAFGSYIKETKCVVGYDNRLSSPELVQTLIDGIISTGVDVINVGLVTTPVQNFACYYLKCPCGIMVTASHNPKDENGFKLMFKDYEVAIGNEIQDFLSFIDQQEFKTGHGKLSSFDITSVYVTKMGQAIVLGSKKLKVIIDGANGTACNYLNNIMQKINIDYQIINGESDGNFPVHHPDPSVEENMTELKELVIKNNADLGISFDGDADRIGVVDNEGNYIDADQLMAIMCQKIIEKNDNKKILYDIKCSNLLSDTILKHGGIPVISRNGRSYVRRKLITENILFGGEFSGHIFFNDRYIGLDDGLYAALRLIELLSNESKKLSEYVAELPKYFSTPELYYQTTDEHKHLLIAELKKYAQDKNYPINELDGVKVEFPDSWALIRMSNTGPKLTMRFEAKTKEQLDKLQAEFTNILPELEKRIG